MAEREADDTDAFKPEFKKYKRKDHNVDLSEVIDLEKNPHAYSDKGVVRITPCSNPSLKPVSGLKNASDWEIYHFSFCEGFYFVKNPFLHGFQQYWVSRCLADLPLPPNVTNLSVHPDVDPKCMWEGFAKNCDKKNFDKTAPLWKLRWTTIGYHYDWNTKEYRGDHCTPFPEDLVVLSKYVAAMLGFPDFRAEAGIVNYYHLDSTLAAHTDHSELTHQAPLLSFSFGLDAIFLLGGLTKKTKPTAILLHSGDICVMSGISRLAYHAVPRILCQQNITKSNLLLHSLPQSIVSKGHCEQKSCKRNASETSKVVEHYKSSRLSSDTLQPCISGSSMLKSGSGHDCGKSCSHLHEGVLDCLSAASSHDQVHREPDYIPASGIKGDYSETNSAKVMNENVLREKNCTDCEMPEYGSKPHKSIENNVNDKVHGGCRAPAESYQMYNSLADQVNRHISSALESLDWRPFSMYMQSSRLNVNIRQVLAPGQTFPRRLSKEYVK